VREKDRCSVRIVLVREGKRKKKGANEICLTMPSRLNNHASKLWRTK